MACASPLGAIATSGCTESQESKTRNCRFNDSPRVSADSVVTLFAINYIYSITTDAYREQARQFIEAAYAGANTILRENGSHVQVASVAMLDKADSVLSVGFEPPPVQALVAVHTGEEQYVGVHWPEWGQQAGSTYKNWVAPDVPCPEPDCNWIYLYGMVRGYTGEADLNRNLARAICAYLSLAPLIGSPGNLMSGTGSGTDLTIAQAQAMWQATNDSRTNLRAKTCDPPAVAP